MASFPAHVNQFFPLRSTWMSDAFLGMSSDLDSSVIDEILLQELARES
jgi:hypothetical protein